MKGAAIPGAPRVAMMRLSAIEQRKCAFESLAEFSPEPAEGTDQRSSRSPRWGEGGNRRRSDGELLPEGRGHAPAFWSGRGAGPVSYTHLRAHETKANLVCRLLLEKKKKTQ